MSWNRLPIIVVCEVSTYIEFCLLLINLENLISDGVCSRYTSLSALSSKVVFEIVTNFAIVACITSPFCDRQFLIVELLSILKELPPVTVNTEPIDPRVFCIVELLMFKLER